MARIYSEASGVLLWLGIVASGFPETVCRYLERVVSEICQALNVTWSINANDRKRWRSLEYEIKELNHIDVIRDMDQPTAFSIAKLCECPVFRRGWVLQEVAHASSLHVHWGGISTDGDWLLVAVERAVRFRPTILHTYHTKLGFGALTRLHMARSDFGSHSTSDFLYHLCFSQYLEFSDERDRVYGLLALDVTECEPGEVFVPPDYTISVNEVYRRVADRLLTKEKNLQASLCVNNKHDFDENTPSWVPDWRSWNFSEIMGGGWGTKAYISHKIIDGREILSIHGARISCVSQKFCEHTSPLSDEELQVLVRQMCSLFDHTCVAVSAVVGSQFIETSFDSSEEYWDGREERSCMSFLDLDLGKHPIPATFVPLDVNSDLGLTPSFARVYRKTMEDRQFFITNDSMLGVGPNILQQGDTLVGFRYDIPSYCNIILFALRSAGSMWRLVGPCYIYAISERRNPPSKERSVEGALHLLKLGVFPANIRTLESRHDQKCTKFDQS